MVRRLDPRKWIVRAAPLSVFLGAFPVWARGPGQGYTSGDLMRVIGIVSALIAIVGLILIEFVYRDRMERSTYRWLLLLGLFVLPATAMMGAVTAVFDETKSVSSCATCHVMYPFVNDLRDPNSPTLAARHARNKWIPDNQCYSCHITYGVHGTLEGKRDGFRHWLLYVTKTYREPIEYSGSYPNVNCLQCHEGTRAFERVPSHQALRPDLDRDAVGCATCHGPPHPAPMERDRLRAKPVLGEAE